MRNYNELRDNEKRLVTTLNDVFKDGELKNAFCDLFGSRTIILLEQYAKQQKEEA